MYTVESLFPIPLYKSKIDYSLSDNDLVLLQGLKYFRRSGSNLSTENTRILDLPNLSDLKISLEQHLNLFAKEVMNYENSFYITHSWININPTGSFHRAHCHVNSIFSGVLYLRIPNNSPLIQFNKPIRSEIMVSPLQWNSYNSPEWKMSVEQGDLLIFPSNLQHEVLPNYSAEDRVSLAFNSFVSGSIGSDNNSDRLDFNTYPLADQR